MKGQCNCPFKTDSSNIKTTENVCFLQKQPLLWLFNVPIKFFKGTFMNFLRTTGKSSSVVGQNVQDSKCRVIVHDLPLSCGLQILYLFKTQSLVLLLLECLKTFMHLITPYSVALLASLYVCWNTLLELLTSSS